MPDATENDSATRGGFTRRAGLAAAWSSPVIAAAVSAPGAAASGVSPSDPPYIGVFLAAVPDVPGSFRILARIGGPAAEFGTPLLLSVPSRIDFVAEHDVSFWGEGIVVDGPRSAHLEIPAGTYRTSVATDLRDGSTFVVGDLIAQPAALGTFTPDPSGTYAVTGSVTRGPVYSGDEQSVFAALGRTTSSALVTV